MHFKNYTLEDLILDPAFINWVKNPLSEDGAIWIEWASLSIENKNILQEAREIILELVKDDDSPVQQELSDLWSRISATNEAFDLSQTKKSAGPRIKEFIKSWNKIAAVLTAFLIVSIVVFFALYTNTKHYTAYGQNKKIVLPDGSLVILNANSSISYPSWDSTKPREIWLEGEGFFSVSHKKNSQKFIVHTSDLDVHVLGTKFNVNTRRGKTRVILNSGKVKLFLAKENNKEVDMKPGELVDFSSAKKIVTRKAVVAAKYSSWVDKKLVFEETTLKEIASMLEENYGYKVAFSAPAIEKQTFTGTIDSGNIDLLFTILQKTFNISIIKKEGNITISTK